MPCTICLCVYLTGTVLSCSFRIARRPYSGLISLTDTSVRFAASAATPVQKSRAATSDMEDIGPFRCAVSEEHKRRQEAALRFCAALASSRDAPGSCREFALPCDGEETPEQAVAASIAPEDEGSAVGSSGSGTASASAGQGKHDKGQFAGYLSWEDCLLNKCRKNPKLALLRECRSVLRFMDPCDLRAAARHAPKLRGDPVLHHVVTLYFKGPFMLETAMERIDGFWRGDYWREGDDPKHKQENKPRKYPAIELLRFIWDSYEAHRFSRVEMDLSFERNTSPPGVVWRTGLYQLDVTSKAKAAVQSGVAPPGSVFFCDPERGRNLYRRTPQAKALETIEKVIKVLATTGYGRGFRRGTVVCKFLKAMADERKSLCLFHATKGGKRYTAHNNGRREAYMRIAPDILLTDLRWPTNFHLSFVSPVVPDVTGCLDLFPQEIPVAAVEDFFGMSVFLLVCHFCLAGKLSAGFWCRFRCWQKGGGYFSELGGEVEQLRKVAQFNATFHVNPDLKWLFERDVPLPFGRDRHPPRYDYSGDRAGFTAADELESYHIPNIKAQLAEEAAERDRKMMPPPPPLLPPAKRCRHSG